MNHGSQDIALLLSPLARAAYFDEVIAVAEAELGFTLGLEARLEQVGELVFLRLACDGDQLPALARLSFVQGLFACEGELMRPVPLDPGWRLPAEFVFGAKYRGKTNETLTQLLLNVGLAALGRPDPATIKLLDPMCGRATTLLWGLRYGMKVRGIEQQPQALADLRQHLKKWCKLTRLKHSLKDGSVGRASRSGEGRLLEFDTAAGNLRVVTGDAADCARWLGGEKFHLLASDLPYGVQHFTTEGTRNPLAVLGACAAGWSDSLRAGGVVVLAFNHYQPKRPQLQAIFEDQGLEPLAFTAPHRMSEAILRDVLVMRKPA